VRAAPGFVMGQYNFAEALAAEGKTAQAAAQLEAFLRLWRGSPEVAERAKRRLRRLEALGKSESTR